MKVFGDAIFIKSCPLCLATVKTTGLCRECLLDLTPLRGGCRICLAPIEKREFDICVRCSAGVPFDQVIALTRYTFSISSLICKLKYHRHIYLAEVLGILLATHIKQHLKIFPELLIPVPLHKQRLQQRGFNQSVEITRTVSTLLNIKTDYRCVEKYKSTPLQTTLDSQHRQHNLKDVFRLRKPIYAKSVAIIDDVITTATTVSEIASLLKANGVSRVEAWALARTSPPI